MILVSQFSTFSDVKGAVPHCGFRTFRVSVSMLYALTVGFGLSEFQSVCCMLSLWVSDSQSVYCTLTFLAS